MIFVLGSRRSRAAAKAFLIAVSAAAVILLGAFGFTSGASAAVVQPKTCDAAIREVNKSLVVVAKRRIQVRTAKKRGAKQTKRAKRNLKNAQKRANAARASVKTLCLGGGGVSAQDSQCMISINTLAKSIELKYTRTLRYKKLKVKGKSKKARKRAAKRKRAMKTELKRLDDKIKTLTQTFQKSCSGDDGDNGGDGGAGGGGGTDTTPPGSVIIDGPDGPSSDPAPTVEITTPETGGRIECRIDGGEWLTVTSPWTLPALSDGVHVITCRYVDSAGNAGEETSITITIDTTAPGAPTVSGPSGATSDTTPGFNLGGAGEGEHYECQVDGGEWVVVEGALFVTEELSEGDHTITCRIVDAAGNTGPSTSATVTIDLSAPGAVTIDGPDGVTNDTTPTIELSSNESGGHFECQVDGGEWQIVPASWTLPELSDGEHVITCRYVDGAGNAGPESSITITVDTTPPGPVLVGGPDGPTNDTTPSFSVSGGGDGVAGYECRVDGGEWTGVTAQYTTPVLGEGDHTVACRAVDAAGNIGPATSTSVTVDTVGPTITIADGAPRWDGTYAFDLSSSEPGTTFNCKVDDGSFATVSASWITGVLATGAHTVSCYGVDAAGNVGPTATRSFNVFEDTFTVSKSGGFQWGLGCTMSSFLNALLGCPDNGLTITIPANPNGATGSYVADLSAAINDATAGLGIGSKYTMHIVVDGASVASDSEIVGFDIFGIFAVDLSAAKTGLTLSADSAHTIQLTLKTSALVNVFPSVQSSSLSVSIHH